VTKKRVCILDYRWCKSWRVARSSIAVETLAVSTAFDAGFTLRHQLAKMLGRHVPLLFMTDGRSLFKVIINHKKTAEERLMLDVYAVREAY
jgi:hypothetical protein